MQTNSADSRLLLVFRRPCMLGRLILLFLITPAVELALLIQVDALIGFWPTVGLIVATGVAGSYLARREGVSTWSRLNQRLQVGDLPGKELVDGVIILVAGALLVTPGVLTDVIGLAGLLPPTRALIRRALIRRFQRKMQDGSIQVQFGIFGGSGFDPSGPGSSRRPPRREPPDDPEPDARWKGNRDQLPGHANGAPPDETDSPSQ